MVRRTTAIYATNANNHAFLNENVAKLLENIPVYTLDKNNMRDVLIKKFAKEIRIEKGQLSLETSMFQ